MCILNRWWRGRERERVTSASLSYPGVKYVLNSLQTSYKLFVSVGLSTNIQFCDVNYICAFENVNAHLQRLAILHGHTIFVPWTNPNISQFHGNMGMKIILYTKWPNPLENGCGLFYSHFQVRDTFRCGGKLNNYVRL